jgi:SAM-dependent methyltransferase
VTAHATIDERREAERRKYLALHARSGGRYGGSNHGRRAIVSVLLRQPRFVVDFGCGSNAFIRELRRRGADGLGIDFADDRADILAPMHAVPLAAGIADVVTSFDALEHLLPEDVDAALAEMRRIARPGAAFVLSVSTRPSRITAHGENLHPTVRPRAWWLERIARVGHVGRPGPYIEGVFHA